MFETVAHEFDATEPAGDADDAVGDVGCLHEAEDDHAGAGFTVVVFGFVNDSFVRETGCPAVVVGFLILFFAFELLEEQFYIFATGDVTDAD